MKEVRLGQARRIGGARCKERFGLDLLEQNQRLRVHTSILVHYKRDKLVPLGARVSGVFGAFVGRSVLDGGSRGRVRVGGAVEVDAGEVVVDRFVREGNHAIRKKVTEIFRDNMSSAIVATSETGKQVAGAIMNDSDDGALELFAAGAVPGVVFDVHVAKCTKCRGVFDGGKAKSHAGDDGSAQVRKGMKVPVRSQPRESALVAT